MLDWWRKLSNNIDNDTQTMHKDVPIIYFEFFLFLVMFPWNGLQKTKGIQVSLLCTWTAQLVIIVKSDDSKKTIRVSAKFFISSSS